MNIGRNVEARRHESLRALGTHVGDQRILCQLGRQIKSSHQEDRHQQVEMARSDIYTLFAYDLPFAKESW